MVYEELRSIFVNSIYAYLFEGAVVIILNVPLTVTMILVNKIRCRREFQVIIGLQITDVAIGTAFMLTGIYRYKMVLNFGSDIPTVLRSECTKELFVQLMTISYQMQGILSMVVAFDRLLAVTIPIKYIKFGNHYNIIIIATPCVTVLIPTVVNFLLTINDHSWVSALCLTREAVYPGFHAYILLMRMACIISSGLIYLYIVLRLKQHLAKHEKVCHRVDTTQLRNIRHSTVTVGLTTINALVFLFIPDIVAYFEIAGIHQNYATVLYSFYCVNVNLNFLILITRHKEIRQNFAYFVRVILLRRHPTATTAQSVNKAASNVAPIRSGARLCKPDPYFISTNL
nr:7TM GPCR domain containing protein [Haemonchus contortus]